jgi:hypothetical protein
VNWIWDLIFTPTIHKRYKIVRRHSDGKLTSLVGGHLSVTYRIGSVVWAPPTGALLVFEDLERALQFKKIIFEPHIKIYQCECYWPVHLPEQGVMVEDMPPDVAADAAMKLWNGVRLPEVEYFDWPEGTMAYEAVRLMFEVSGDDQYLAPPGGALEKIY